MDIKPLLVALMLPLLHLRLELLLLNPGFLGRCRGKYALLRSLAGQRRYALLTPFPSDDIRAWQSGLPVCQEIRGRGWRPIDCQCRPAQLHLHPFAHPILDLLKRVLLILVDAS